MSIIKRGLIYLVTVAYLCACAQVVPAVPVVPVVSEAQRSRMGTVGVAALASAPQGDFRGNVPQRLTYSSQGASQGAKDAAAGAIKGTGVACNGSDRILICIAYIVLLPIIVPVAAIGGAVYGGVQSVPNDKAGEIEDRLWAVLAEADQQGKLRFAVVDAAARAGVQGVTEITAGMPITVGQDVDHQLLPDAKADTILEVGIVSVSFIGLGGSDPSLALHVDAVARLVDARTNKELYHVDRFTYETGEPRCAKWLSIICGSYPFTYETGPRKFSEWGADGGRLIKEQIESAYQSLGRSIVDNIFLVVQTNHESAQKPVQAPIQASVSGFRPVYPVMTWSTGLNALPDNDILGWPKVDSLQPTLRWQPFPGEHQQFAGGKVTPFVAVDPGSVRDVRYELQIWSVWGQAPGELAYEVNGLTEPFHKFARPLKPNTEYYWSVRARFSLDGQPRASEWSLSQVPCPPNYGIECARGIARWIGRIPPPNHYRFKTPPQ